MAKQYSTRGNTPLYVALIGIVGYFLYEAFKNKAGASTPTALPSASGVDSIPLDSSVIAVVPQGGGQSLVVSAPQPLPGSMAPTTAAVTNAASIWSQLAPTQAFQSGYINFGSGSQVPASLFQYGNTATDGSGNYFVSWAGGVWQLGAQDNQGNWSATQIA